MKKTHTIKWVLFHEPVELFVRTAEVFAKEIDRLTDGRISIEVYKIDEYADKFNGGVFQDPVTLLKNGDIQMSQVQTNWLGMANAVDFFALDMPYLFRSHDHATKVLDGEIGRSMLDSLPAKTGLRGLAFTYSGGYRCLASKEPINSVEDLKGRSMVVRMNPINSDMVRAFGAEPTVFNDLVVETRKENSREFDTVQTTFPRYQAQVDSSTHPYVINTRHNMFLTTIIVDEKFWAELDAEDQAAMREAAAYSAVLERQWSIDDAAKIEQDLAEQQRLGIKEVIELPEAESEKLKESSQAVYIKYKDVFSSGLIDSILGS